MPFEGAVRSRVAAWMRPWLLAEPDAEFKLGFLRCQGTWRDLELDPANLNPLVKGSTHLAFRRVTIGELTVRFSPWSSATFYVGVRGFHVTLAPRELDAVSSRRTADSDAEEKNLEINSIDPEGALLRGVLENALKTASSGSWLRTSLTEALLGRCRFQFQDVRFQVDFTEESNACLLKAGQLSVEPQLLDEGSACRGIPRVFFVLRKKSYSLAFNCSCLEFGLKEDGLVKILVSARDPYARVRLEKLKPTRFDVHFPLVDSGFSPMDIPVIFLLSSMFREPSECGRSGKVLWKIATRKIGQLRCHPRVSLQNLVNTVLLWLKYLHAYESLVSMIGYSNRDTFKQLFTRLCNDLELVKRVRHQLKVVDELEKRLPVEAVRRARWIARQKALLCPQSSVSESADLHMASKEKFFIFLLFIWKFMYILLHSVANVILALWTVFNSHRQIHEIYLPPGVYPSELDSQNCVNIMVGELCISVHPVSVAHTTSKGKVEPDRDISQLNLDSVFISLKSFCLSYVMNRVGRSVFLVLGDFQVHLSPSSRVPPVEGDLELETTPTFRVPWAETGDGSHAIIWSEPAHVVYSPGATRDNKQFTSDGQAMILENCLRELWSSWKRTGDQLEGNNFHWIDRPFILFEFKNFFVTPNRSNTIGGLLKCSMALGRLNFHLEYASVISFARLFRQALASLRWISNTVKSHFPSNSGSINNEKKRISLEEQLELLFCTLKIAVLNLMPENNIQVGAMIAGPSIKISLRDFTEKGSTHAWSSFLVELEGIDVAVWPASRATLLEFNPGLVIKSPEEWLWLKEPQTLDVSKGQLNESFVSRGRISHNTYITVNALTVFFKDLENNQRSQVFGGRSIVISASACRRYFHSFYLTENACSLSLSATAGEADVLVYMDELCVLLQVFEGMLHITSVISVSYDYAVLFNSREYIRKFMLGKKESIRYQMAIGSEDKSILLQDTQFAVDGYLEFGYMNGILCNSRKKHFTKMKVDGASSSTTSYHDQILLNLSDFGMGIFLPKSSVQISLKRRCVELLADLLEVRSVIFKPQSEMNMLNDVSMIKDIRHHSGQLCEFSLSHFIFHLSVACDVDFLCSTSGSAINGSASSSSEPVAKVGPFIPLSGGRTLFQSHGSPQEVPSIHIPVPGSSFCFISEMELGEIFMADCSMKNLLTGRHQPSRFQLLFSGNGGFHTISFENQGSCFFVETSTLAMFVQSLKAYYLCLTSLPVWASKSSRGQCENAESLVALDESMARPSNLHCQEYTKTIVCPMFSSEWLFFNSLEMNVSDFSVTFAATDGSGGIQYVSIEVDINLKLMSLERNLSFNILNLSVFSQHLQKNILSETKINLFPVRSRISATKGITSGVDNTQSPRVVSEREISLDNVEYGLPLLNNLNYILKHLSASIRVEKASVNSEIAALQLKNDWVGSGVISGFDLTVSLSEIQMLLAILAPLAGISSANSGKIRKQNFSSQTQGRNNDSNFTIPDGAIIAIQDPHQHLYFAVEGVGVKYRVVSALHYSLVGERALFRVKWHKQKSSLFSLTSLYAKNDAGEPLRLNFCPGSGFVEITSTNDKGWALWKILPYKADNYGDDDDTEFSRYRSAVGKAFHLVNHKNNSGVAFVDEFPEFVQKPGSPFKVKVFHELSSAYDTGKMDGPNFCRAGSVESETVGGTSREDVNRSVEASHMMRVDITIDRIVFTICHEVSDAADKFPLVRGCIGDVHIIGQILPPKFRLMCMHFIAVDYFNAQSNSWKKIISPADACFFLHYRVTVNSSANVQKRIPAHYYFRIKQVDISLTDLSLDILLFVAGKLNLAGPYELRSSIFCNCCKVVNHSSLNLICHFGDNQEAMVAGKQSASVFLRNMSLADQVPDFKSSVSIYASKNGGFSTLPLQISLSNARMVAWRTCVVSQQDSRILLGPSLVVEVSQKTEDGLSLSVSPLSRIHNASGFSLELYFRTSHETEVGSITIPLQMGDTVDDSTALLDGLDFSGSLKRAMMSLSGENLLFSLKPEISGLLEMTGKPISVDWSEDMISGKIVPLSGIFDKLSYRFRKAFGVASMKSSLSTVRCPLIVEGCHVSYMHFLIQIIGRDVPIVDTPNVGNTSETEAFFSTFQKEIFISPTVQVFNLLRADIRVVLTETYPDPSIMKDHDDIGKAATIGCGSSAYFYANPSSICFTVTLTAFNSTCKPVDSSECVKKLQKQKNEAHYFDVELDFNGGRYFVHLRLSCGDKGVLEATVFTSYTLQNETELSLFCFSSSQKTLSRLDNEKYTSTFASALGTFLPPMSTKTWFSKSKKVHLRLMKEKACESSLDLDTLSGFTELRLEYLNESGVRHVAKVGVSVKPCASKVFLPALLVSIVPRYVISNESMEPIIIRQCDLENDADGITQVDGKQRAMLYMHANMRKRSTTSLFDSVFKKHRSIDEDSVVFFQFSLKGAECSWSGPICISSLGHFFMKFKTESVSFSSGLNTVTDNKSKVRQFASVHIVEESSSLVLYFHMPPDVAPPYRIENCLRGVSVTYYQKGSGELERLEPGNSLEFVWDDVNLPHKLVVQISGMQMLREINIDKISTWKPFFKTRQDKLFTLHSPLNRMSGSQKTTYGGSHGFEILRLGYEVYADGLTRVVRICELGDSYKERELLQPHANFQFRLGHFATSLLENGKQDEVASVPQPFIVARIVNVTLDSLSTNQCTYYSARAKSINVDNKWQGAPFASMVRRSQLNDPFLNEDMLHCLLILHSRNSNVKQVKRFSLVLQPIDLNLDEETLMKLATFWRTSLSDSKTQNQLYYFKQFEIHPLKITASFHPGNPYSSYSSAQETLRSFLHSVIKVPAVKNTVIELNGVLLNHALVTKKELLIKCAQHYSWYIVRAVYIAKGSPLLPPAFASIFDDAASSSLDVFFDPSVGSINLPGFTLGMFKFISKCIDSKGFSGTKRYFGDLSKTMKKTGSNVLFAAVTEISDSILKGAETDGFNGLVNGFHQGILRLAMEPSLLGSAVMQGGPDRKIILDRSPGVNELYIEGYLQAMLHATYKQEYLQVKVTDNLVYLKNLPPNSSLINEIVENVKSFLVSEGLLKGEQSSTARPLRHLRGEREWKIGPMVLTLCEHLFVSFVIRMLRKQADKLIVRIRSSRKMGGETGEPSHPPSSTEGNQEHPSRIWAVGSFVLSGMFAYVDGWLCRRIPNPIARRIVSGFLLTFLDSKHTK